MRSAVAEAPRQSCLRAKHRTNLGTERARNFLNRASCLLEGYFSGRSRQQLTRLARLMKRYFPEQWDLEWIRDEIEIRSTKRVYIATAGRKGVQGAAILFMDERNREIACLQIEFSEQGEICGKAFSFHDNLRK